jgi:hypothetical protein
MPLTIAILEDDARRREAMEAVLRRRLPQFEIAFFTVSQAMNEWLAAHLAEVVIASLDHDLELMPGAGGKLVDQGCGRDVVDYLIQRPAAFPVLVHSTNAPAASAMAAELEERGWTIDRVTPYDDLAWVEEAWWPALRGLLRSHA